MTDLVEFIRARIAEDRAAAHAARGPSVEDDYLCEWFPWMSKNGRVDYVTAGDYVGEGQPDIAIRVQVAEDPEAVAQHIARNDPAATLVRCNALDALSGLHGPVHRDYGAPWCMNDGHDFPCPTLRTLAAIWSSHSDYRQEWSA